MIWDYSLYSNCKCIHVNGLPLIVNSNSALTGENVLKYGKSLVLKYQMNHKIFLKGREF